MKLCGFTNVDWAWSPLNQMSRSGGIFSVGSTTVSWYNKKQIFVALILAKEKYIDASQATCEEI